eukprot:TRINITY_DN1061_c0_g2_i1.p1 TRINITY_DN1061_c0_g2~~TRINITY_DN1061_c0_g2_i1.p1  ORF type:complete len:470 (-),score=81.51 TRINITY_DN1061_c0_g2_i1:631-1956(-)
MGGKTSKDLIELHLSKNGYVTSPRIRLREGTLLAVDVNSGPGLQGIAMLWNTAVFLEKTKTGEIARVVTRSVINSSESNLASVSAEMARINLTTIVGSFELDMRDGEISFKTAIPTEISGKTLSNVGVSFGCMLNRHIETVKGRGARLLALAKSGSPVGTGVGGGALAAALADADSTGSSSSPSSTEEHVARLMNLLKMLQAVNGGAGGGAGGKGPEINPAIAAVVPPPSPPPQVHAPDPAGGAGAGGAGPTIIPSDKIAILKDKDGQQITLGTGGFATVFKGEWHGLEVAVKVLSNSLPRDLTEDFSREVAVMSKLRHPHIILILGLSDNPKSIVMPFMKKGSLQKVLADDGDKMTFQTKLKYLIHAAKGMVFVHGNNILHGDLKPLNVLVDENDVAYVSDFGLAVIKASASSMNAGTMVVGFSLAYSAPELLSDGIMTR